MSPTVPHALLLLAELAQAEWQPVTAEERAELGTLTVPPELSPDAMVATISQGLASALEAASDRRAPLHEMQGGRVYCSDRDGLEVVVSLFPKPDAPGEEVMRFCFGAELRIAFEVAG